VAELIRGARKDWSEIRPCHPLDTHRNRQTGFIGVLERMSKMTSFGKDTAVASGMASSMYVTSVCICIFGSSSCLRARARRR
jgi:hypothetical protein